MQSANPSGAHKPEGPRVGEVCCGPFEIKCTATRIKLNRIHLKIRKTPPLCLDGSPLRGVNENPKPGGYPVGCPLCDPFAPQGHPLHCTLRAFRGTCGILCALGPAGSPLGSGAPSSGEGSKPLSDYPQWASPGAKVMQSRPLCLEESCGPMLEPPLSGMKDPLPPEGGVQRDPGGEVIFPKHKVRRGAPISR